MSRSIALLLLLLTRVIAQTAAPGSYDAEILAGNAALNERKFDEAFAHSQTVWKLDAGRYEAHALAATASLRLGNLGAAEQFIQMALSRAPDEKKAELNQTAAAITAAVKQSGAPTTVLPPAAPPGAPTLAVEPHPAANAAASDQPSRLPLNLADQTGVQPKPPLPTVPPAPAAAGDPANAGNRTVSTFRGTEVFDISKLDQQPQPRFQARPQYPFEMRRAGKSGEVVVDFIVDTNGDVQNAYARKSSQREFEAAAVQAVSKWKFRPGRKAGRNVNTHMQVPIVFSLNGN